MPMTSIVIALIGAGASASAAIIAGLYARSAHRSDSEAQRARELEGRISEQKFAVYKPMIELLGDLLDQSKTAENAERADAIQTQIADFSTWVNIYGSDEAVKAFHDFKQAAFHQPLPPLVSVRLYADLILAARRDIGYPSTTVSRAHILGIRITDLYEVEDFRLALELPFDELCKREGWAPPWLPASTLAVERKPSP